MELNHNQFIENKGNTLQRLLDTRDKIRPQVESLEQERKPLFQAIGNLGKEIEELKNVEKGLSGRLTSHWDIITEKEKESRTLTKEYIKTVVKLRERKKEEKEIDQKILEDQKKSIFEV